MARKRDRDAEDEDAEGGHRVVKNVGGPPWSGLGLHRSSERSRREFNNIFMDT